MSPAATRWRSPSSRWACCWRSTGISPTTSPISDRDAGTRSGTARRRDCWAERWGSSALVISGSRSPSEHRASGWRSSGGAGAGEWDSELARHPNVVGTHHIGASTEQAQRAIAQGVVEIIDAFQRGEVLNCVNLAPTRLGTCTLHVRHFDRAGVLAAVFDILRRREINVEQMENRIFAGKKVAGGRIDIAGGG